MRLKLDTKNSVKKKLDFAIQGKVKRSRYERLKKVISDGGYRGDDLKHLIKNQFSIDFEVRTKDVECKKEFTPIPQRWKVERTFSWLENFRRLSMDYEYHIDSFEAMVKIAAIKIAFKKI
ncbi:MAG: transposase [Bacteroidaceae bacterium]|nr:transposase [Bacteroidaceae bacterium]